MKLVRQATFLLFIAFMGEVLNKVFLIPLPGSVLGLLVLLALLLLKWIRLEQIEELSTFLMSHLAIFFVPAGVGLITVLGILQEAWLILLVISVTTTQLVLIATAFVVQQIRRRKK
ncbi:MAG: CidA/LrgA family protein [Clostridium sp.]|jgi:holin-like protein|nr:CidA/LrgA family protein [Clostridium sp.]